MPINLASFIQPRNATHPDPELRNTYYMVEDIFVKGGFQVRESVEDRDSIIELNRKPGMLIYTLADKKIWQLDEDLVTWNEFSFGGGSSATRASVEYSTRLLQPNAYEDFSLPLGKVALLETLRLSAPVTIEAFDTEDKLGSNPYRFIATADHLADDGQTLMSDGTVLSGRRYAILANGELEPTANIFFRITNSSPVEMEVTVSITYLPLEQ